MTSRSAFTLIEILVVIAVVAILSVVVILVVNPAEILRQTRDSSRLSDMQTLDGILGMYAVDVNSGGMGVASTVYVSVYDPAATTTAGTYCSGMGLPALPTGWNYHCPASSTMRRVDGTGWIPVNFGGMTSGAPISSLPIDPVNATSTGQYYTYAPGSWELTTQLESSKHGPKAISDGGQSPGFYERGSDLKLTPFVRGTELAGYGDFRNWTLANGATTNSDGTVLTFTAYNQTAWSPYIPINNNANWRVSAEFFMTDQSPYAPWQPNGGMIWSGYYYGASYASVTNTYGYSNNGNAQQVPLSAWTSKIWTEWAGTNVVYVRVYVQPNSTYTPASFSLRNFRMERP